MLPTIQEQRQSTMKRIGYWISEKKARKLNFDEFESHCRNADLQLVRINLDQQLEEQGPFELILHKLTDQIAKADQGNPRARQHIENFQKFTNHHPDVVILDPLENILKVLDRHEQYKFVKECDVVEENCHYFTPAFAEFTTNDVETNKKAMEENGVQYPFVCKPSVAHGSSASHQMSIIFNEKGLQDVQPPCVAQTFINHNAALYKIFVIGNHHFIVERPSIKNFSAGGTKTIFFDSQGVSKADSTSFLNVMSNSNLEFPLIEPDTHKLERLSLGIQQMLGLTLFGIDVIIENHTGRYAVIDINAFPGYDGVPDFFQVLLNVILDKIEKRPNQVYVHNDLNRTFQRLHHPSANAQVLSLSHDGNCINNQSLSTEHVPSVRVGQAMRDEHNKVIMYNFSKCDPTLLGSTEDKKDEEKEMVAAPEEGGNVTNTTDLKS